MSRTRNDPEGKQKREIQKKQYLGERSLTFFIVEEEIEQIGDWAFAYCDQLKWIALPKSLKKIGKEIFKGCAKLSAIWFYDKPEKTEGFTPEKLTCGQWLCGELNAIALREFKDPQRLVTAYHRAENSSLVWDQECKTYLATPDEEGFQPFLAGGEEDYEGGEEAVMQYRHRTRCKKAGILLKRLLTDQIAGGYSTKEWQLFYQEQLKQYPETLEIIAGTRKHLKETVDICEAAGLLTGENIHKIMERIPAGNVELRALLLQKADKDTEGLWEL